MTKKKLALALTSGVLWSFCFATTLPPLLSWVALVPFFLSLDHTKPFRCGWIFGCVYWLLAMRWIIGTLEDFGKAPPGLSHFLFVLLAGYLALESGVFAWLAARLWRRHDFTALWALPALWIVLESVRGIFFGGFPWNLAGYAWVETPGALRLSSFVGASGVGFLLVLANVAFAWGWRRRDPWVPAWTVLGILLVLTWAGRFAPTLLPSAGPSQAVAIIQPNSPIVYDEALIKGNYRRLVAMSEAACDGNSPLLIWPESAVWPYSWESSASLRADVMRLNERGCRVFFNSAETKPEGYYNAALLAGPWNLEGHYAKRKLVPWGETIPLKSILPFVGYLARNAGEFQPGQELGLMKWSREDLAPAICFEVIFAGQVAEQVRAGGSVLITITNDAWYGETAAPRQHLRAARFRAAENGRPLLRAALTGVSALIDARGVIVEELEIGREGVIRGRVSGSRELTFFTRMPSLALILAAMLSAFAILRRPQK